MTHPITYWVPRQTEPINEFAHRYGFHLEKLSTQAKREILLLLSYKVYERYALLDLAAKLLYLKTHVDWLDHLCEIDLDEPTCIGLMQGILHFLEGDLARNADEPNDFSSGARE